MSERKRFTPWLMAGVAAAAPVAGAQPVSIAAPPTEPVAPRASQPQAGLTVGVRPEYTRLAFRFPAGATVTPLLSNDRLELRFSRAAAIDLAEVRATLPPLVRSIQQTSRPGAALAIALTLDPGARQRHFVDGERVVVDILPPDGLQNAAAPARPGQLPEAGGAAALAPAVRGTGAVRLVEEAQATKLTVRWPAPARAAAFRRGEAIYVLFEANGTLDLRGVTRAGRRHRDLELINSGGVVGLRIPAPPDVLVSARADGATWEFTLGPRAAVTAAAPVRLDSSSGGRMLADFGRGGVIKSITDPEIGDRLIVALTQGPAIGVEMRRATIEAAILPSAQGAAIEPRADGVGAMFEGGRLVVSREAGLITAGAADAAAAPARDTAALEAELITNGDDGAVTALSLKDVRDRIAELERRAAGEGVAEGAPVVARMALARFLLANELAPETLGALRLAGINQPEIELDPEYRLIRAAANVMMHRTQDAKADLAASALQDDPSAALWRGYAAALEQNWTDARRELERGAGALEQHPPNWRARFALALAESALEVNDFDAAETAARAAIGQAQSQAIRLHARLVEARLAAARGKESDALALYDELARARDEEVAVRASLEAVKLRRTQNQMPPAEAAEKLEALRYRWRGDGMEIETVSALGSIYVEMSRWRDALATMRVAADRFPREPATRKLQGDMQAIFTRLFLEGEADKLEPIQSLGLFYEFADLTPIGPDGDRIVRGLAGRLVTVDLLEQACSLLQHQVDERLDGVSKAQVASELAAIYLMDRKPEQALAAIAASRVPNLPAPLVAQRRILEARIQLDLGRLDHAVELVERDQSTDAQRVRAEAAWRARDWERAAAELRTVLGARSRATPLDADGRQVVLRTAIALTLSQNEQAVRQLYRDYAGDMAGTDDADAFEVVAGSGPQRGTQLRDVARAVARTDLLDRFLQGFKTRMTAAVSTAPAPAATPARAAQTATPPRA